MTYLCIDTSQATAVAVVRDGETVGRARNESGRHHAESITPCVREALAAAGLPLEIRQAGLEAVCVGTGPAPFTGLRAGLVSARVLARVAEVPVYGVSSLDVLARQALDVLSPETHVYALSDARRRELYWGHYVAEGPDDVSLIGRLEVGGARLLGGALREAPGLLVAETGIPAHSAEELAGAQVGPLVPLDPAVMVRMVRARLARGEDAHVGTEPLYLRRPDIHGQTAERM